MERLRKSEAELVLANTALAFQNEEREKRAAELVLANIELAFQNEEKEKRAAELVLANIELAFQNDEKEKRASELAVANTELIFQNEEKEKRAAELVLANKELLFQNGEKEKRAAELILANKELIFQNREKEKRTIELILANEKEKKAIELFHANKTLILQNEEKEKRTKELTRANEELKKAENYILQLNDQLEHKIVERTTQLESVNKELESFSYSVSHDLRAPLRAISGNSKILEEDYSEKFDEEGKRALNSIRHYSKNMGELIDDLLAFSRLGRKQVSVSDINMNNLVRTIKAELPPSDQDARTEFRILALPPAKGDVSLIKQVWTNLISNALKYSKNKPKSIIEIGGKEEGERVVYYIKDNGAGFDMQYYDKLFGVFQRLHSQEEFEGTGIGLAIIQKIVNRHSGTVWAESKLNEETYFYFTLSAIHTNPQNNE